MSVPSVMRELDRVENLMRNLPHDRLPLSTRIRREIEIDLAAPLGLIGMLDEVAAEFLPRPTGSAGRVPNTGNRP